MIDRHNFSFKIQNAMYMITYCTVFAILISAVFAARGAWSKQGSYEYYVSEDTSTTTKYTSSQATCKKEDGQLALIKSQETQEFIQSLVLENSGVPYGFYIGLQDTDGDGTFIWDDGIPTDYTNWNGGEPNNFAEEKCVIVGHRYTYKSNLPWYNFPCNSASSGTKGYVCERLIGWNWGAWSPWGQCDCPGIMMRNRSCVDTLRSGPYSCNGTEIASQTCSPTGVCNVTLPQATTTPTPKGRGVWVADAGFEYYVSKEDETRTFEGSQQYCSDKDAVLAHVLSQEVQSFIQSLVFENSGQPYGFYIGLKYDLIKEEYIWSDGTSFVFTNWYSSQPQTDKGECVVMGSPYTYNEKLAWYSAHCAATTDGQKGLVCQRRIGEYWDSWSLCDCSISNQTRSRECINSGRHGPNNCNGKATEVQNCPFDSACFPTTNAVSTANPTTTSVHATTVPVTTLVPASTEMPTTRTVTITTPVPTTSTVTTTTIVPTVTTAMTPAAPTTNPTLPTTTPVLATTAVPTTATVISTTIVPPETTAPVTTAVPTTNFKIPATTTVPVTPTDTITATITTTAAVSTTTALPTTSSTLPATTVVPTTTAFVVTTKYPHTTAVASTTTTDPPAAIATTTVTTIAPTTTTVPKTTAITTTASAPTPAKTTVPKTTTIPTTASAPTTDTVTSPTRVPTETTATLTRTTTVSTATTYPTTTGSTEIPTATTYLATTMNYTVVPTATTYTATPVPDNNGKTTISEFNNTENSSTAELSPQDGSFSIVGPVVGAAAALVLIVTISTVVICKDYKRKRIRHASNMGLEMDGYNTPRKYYLDNYHATGNSTDMESERGVDEISASNWMESGELYMEWNEESGQQEQSNTPGFSNGSFETEVVDPVYAKVNKTKNINITDLNENAHVEVNGDVYATVNKTRNKTEDPKEGT